MDTRRQGTSALVRYPLREVTVRELHEAPSRALPPGAAGDTVRATMAARQRTAW